MKNKTSIGVFVVATIVLLAVGSVAAFGLGFGQMAKGDLTDEEKAQMQEFRTNVETAIENNDYATWKSLMESELSEENFNLLVEQHSQMSEMKQLREQLRTAMENGDTETANQLRTQMQGLMPEKVNTNGMGFARGERNGFEKGMGHGMMNKGECPSADSNTETEETE